MRFGLPLAALLLCVSSTSRAAATVNASSLTMVHLRPEMFEGEARTNFATLEFLQLRARGIDSQLAKDLGVLVSAWGAVQPVTAFDKTLDGDVDLAFVEGRLLNRRLRLRLGRQFVVGGVARASFVDGVSVDFEGPRGLGAFVSFGMPVARRFSTFASGQWELDTRVRWSPRPALYSLSASYSHVEQTNQIVRQEIGLDARARLVQRITLVGAAMWSIPDERLSELDLGPRFQIDDSLELALDYRRALPDLLIPRNSIFSVFAEYGRDELGASLMFEPTRWLSLFADARGLRYEDDLGDDAGVEATLRAVARPDRQSPTSLSAQFRLLHAPFNGFVLGRVGATHQLAFGLSGALEFEVYHLEEPINGERLSFAGSASLGWLFARAWQLSATFWQSATPYFESRSELMAKLTYVLPTWEAK